MVNEEMRDVCHGLRGLEEIGVWLVHHCLPQLAKPPLWAAFFSAQSGKPRLFVKRLEP